MYYRRYTSTTSFAVYDYMKENWLDTNNTMHADFDIFSTYADALAKENPWNFCTYNDPGVGFPRNCGKTRRAVQQKEWTSWTYRHCRGPTGSCRDVAYYIELAANATVAPTLYPECFDVDAKELQALARASGFRDAVTRLIAGMTSILSCWPVNRKAVLASGVRNCLC